MINWKVELTAGGKGLPEGENPVRFVQGISTVTIITINSDYVTQSHT